MAFNVIEAPNKFKAGYWKNKTIFLAGGISNCPDWQSEAIQILNCSANIANKYSGLTHSSYYTILNPRRADFDTSNEAESVKQITWEYKALAKSSKVLFWFPEETLCPITLLELGKELMRRGRFERGSANLYIGCHPNYKRKMDVEIQTKLAKPRITIHTSLHAVVSALAGGL